jgi:hypothetical protein
MKNFVELPVSKVIVNLDRLSFIQLVYGEKNSWKMISFNHTAMGTNNITIGVEDYNFLYKLLINN